MTLRDTSGNKIETGLAGVDFSTRSKAPDPTGLDFGAALDMIRAGGKVARAGWNGKGMWVALSPGFVLPASCVYSNAVAESIGTGVGVFRPYLIMKTVEGEYVPWLASQTDLLATDWRPAS